MIIRLSTPTRQLRFQCDTSDVLHSLITSKLNIASYTAKFDNKEIDTGKTIEELQIKHGAEVQLSNIVQNEPEKVEQKQNKQVQETNDNKNYSAGYDCYKPEQEKVVCSHDKSAMCMNCAPKNPWDPSLHRHAKYLAFDAYKEMHKQEKVILDPVSYKRIECDKHNKNATCTACHPRAILLEPQLYRMVDHIEFDNKDVIDHFCSFYRQTKRQRIGFLVGKYLEYDRVPMGEKALVSWVYEPVQESFPDGFVIDNDVVQMLFATDKNTDGDCKSVASTNTSSTCSIVDESEAYKDVKKHKTSKESVKALKKLMSYFDMQIVGVIYTDLGSQRDYICSGLEIEFMAKMQQANLYYCKDIQTNINSKFVTVIVTNDTEQSNNFVLNEYQVSEQAMELVQNELICATEDPQKMKIVQNSVVVPDILYRDINEYKINTQIKADPFLPVEYFLVRLTHGYKHTNNEKTNPFFRSSKYFDWRFGNKKMHEYFAGEIDKPEMYSNLNLLIKMKMDVKKLEQERMRREAEELARINARHKREREERRREERARRIQNLEDVNDDIRIIGQDNNAQEANANETNNVQELNAQETNVMDVHDYNKDLRLLMKYIKHGRMQDFDDFCKTEYFVDLKETLAKYAVDEWSCNACTYVNVNAETCAMCGSEKT